MDAEEQRPLLSKALLPSDQAHHTGHNGETITAKLRHQIKRYLTSKTGHYTVIFMVSADITSIFAEFLITILACEGRVGKPDAEIAQTVCGIIGLVFSCLFLLELVASMWAFGWKFFQSWFHALDAIVILAGFVIDVLLKGVLEEIGSLVVVLRFWRIFKIIEELSAGAEEQMEPLHEKIIDLERENHDLQHEISVLKNRSRMN